MRYIGAVFVTFLISTHLYALDFEEMLDKAVDLDARLKRAALSIESQRMRIEKRKASDKMQLSFSLGGPSYTFNASPLIDSSSTSALHTAALGATVAASFGYPFFSSVSFNLSTDTSFQAIPALKGRLSVSQPLNSLLGWQPTTARDLEERTNLEKAQISLLLERFAIKKELVGDIKRVIDKQLKVMDLDDRIVAVRASEEREKRMGTYKQGSYQALSSQLSIEESAEEKEIVFEELNAQLKRLSERIGVEQFSIPEKLPNIPLAAPALTEENKNPAVYFAQLDLALAEEKHKEAGYSRYPDLSVSSSLSIDSLSLSTSFSLSWKFFDGGLFELSQMEYENTLEILRMNLRDAKRNYQRAVENMGFAIKNLQFRRNNLKRDRALTTLQLEEFKEQVQKGLKTEQQYEELKEESEKEALKYNMLDKLIDLDAYLIWLDKRALIALALKN